MLAVATYEPGPLASMSTSGPDSVTRNGELVQVTQAPSEVPWMSPGGSVELPRATNATN